MLSESEQYFVKNDNDNNSNNFTKQTSGDVDEDMNVDEKIGDGSNGNKAGFLSPLQRKLNKNINDLKGMFNMDEEEC